MSAFNDLLKIAGFAVLAAVLLCVAASLAGTRWPAVGFVIGLVAAVFVADWVCERRPSKSSPLERFERRQADRERRAA